MDYVLLCEIGSMKIALMLTSRSVCSVHYARVVSAICTFLHLTKLC